MKNEGSVGDALKLSHRCIAHVDVVSSDILSRNGKSVTMQDQSQGKTRREHASF